MTTEVVVREGTWRSQSTGSHLWTAPDIKRTEVLGIRGLGEWKSGVKVYGRVGQILEDFYGLVAKLYPLYLAKCGESL